MRSQEVAKGRRAHIFQEFIKYPGPQLLGHICNYPRLIAQFILSQVLKSADDDPKPIQYFTFPETYQRKLEAGPSNPSNHPTPTLHHFCHARISISIWRRRSVSICAGLVVCRRFKESVILTRYPIPAARPGFWFSGD